MAPQHSLLSSRTGWAMFAAGLLMHIGTFSLLSDLKTRAILTVEPTVAPIVVSPPRRALAESAAFSSRRQLSEEQKNAQRVRGMARNC